MRKYCDGCKDDYPVTEQFFERQASTWHPLCIACRLQNDRIINQRAWYTRLQQQRLADGRDRAPHPGGQLLRIAKYGGRLQLFIGKGIDRAIGSPEKVRPIRRGEQRLLEVCGRFDLGYKVVRSGIPHFHLGRGADILDLPCGYYQAEIGTNKKTIVFGRLVSDPE